MGNEYACSGMIREKGVTISGAVHVARCPHHPTVVIHGFYSGSPACNRHIGQVVRAVAMLDAKYPNRAVEVKVTPWEGWQLNYPDKPVDNNVVSR